MDAAAWQKSLGWDESAARRTQIITGSVGLVLLFIGVVMQWWAGNNISGEKAHPLPAPGCTPALLAHIHSGPSLCASRGVLGSPVGPPI